MDGTITTQPEFSFWFTDVGYGVENYGTDPDIEVDIAPHQFRDGEDPQMDKAIALILQETKAKPFMLPDFSERPSLPIPAVAGRAAGRNGNGAGGGKMRRVLKAPKVKTTSKTGTKASTNTSTKAKAKADTKAESKVAVKTRAKTKPKTQPKAKPKVKPKVKPKTKSRAGAGGSAPKRNKSK